MFSRYFKYLLIPTIAVLLLGPATARALPKTGQQLPAFAVTTPAGQKITNQNYSGRVLLLVFSTEYCSACKKAVPIIGKLADHYGKQGFHVLGMFSGLDSGNDDLNKYIKAYGVTYPMALFEQSLAMEQFGVVSVPYSLLIGKKGLVAGVYYGYSDGVVTQMEAQIKKLLAE